MPLFLLSCFFFLSAFASFCFSLSSSTAAAGRRVERATHSSFLSSFFFSSSSSFPLWFVVVRVFVSLYSFHLSLFLLHDLPVCVFFRLSVSLCMERTRNQRTPSRKRAVVACEEFGDSCGICPSPSNLWGMGRGFTACD